MEKFSVYSPLTNERIVELDYMGYEKALSLIKKASDNFINWKNLAPKQRSIMLNKWHDLVNQNQEKISNILSQEQGKPFAEALEEVIYGNSFIKYYAEEVLRIYGEASQHFKPNQWFINLYEPIGVVAAITPWNFPCAMITKKVAPALASGCPVVLKPSEETPLTAIILRDLAIEAGIPEEVFGIIYGDYNEIGRAFLESEEVKMISFTGSIKVGKYLMEQSSSSVKKLVLELGGNAPCIICADADLELAVKRLIIGKFRNAGQACTSPNRIFINKAIEHKFTNMLIQELEKNNYEIGPLINRQAKEKAQNLIDNAIQKGAKLIYEAKNTKASDLYFTPKVISGLDDNFNLVKEEAFAPIFSLLTFEDEEEVIYRSNDTNYGLAAYIFTLDNKKGLNIARRLNFGVIAINDCVTASDITVHGGFNESGLGREGGRLGLMEYYENKFIVF